MTITVRTGFDRDKQQEIYEKVTLTGAQARELIQEQALEFDYKQATAFASKYKSQRQPFEKKKKYKRCTTRR